MLKFVAGVVVGIAFASTPANPKLHSRYVMCVRRAGDFLTMHANEMASDLRAKKEKTYR